MSMRVQLNLCNITSVRPSKEGTDAYVNLSSKNDDGTVSQFSLTFKNTRATDFQDIVLQPVSFSGVITGVVWQGQQRLQAVGKFGAPVYPDKKQGA